jgi:hypothetical protein
VPDVYTYDEIPATLRVQIIHIWHESIGNVDEISYPKVEDAYKFVVTTLRREYGLFVLSNYPHTPLEELANFFLAEKDTERVIDAIELTFRVIDRYTRDVSYRGDPVASKVADNSIEELNIRFKEHGLGYQYEKGEIIRVDSQLLHANVVKPAIELLHDTDYAGAQQEFLNAYEHYRHGKHKEALNEALKALESTMKVICDKRKWSYGTGDTSKQLIDICCKKGLIPIFWQQNMAALRSLLEGGVPTGRNKLSGHGQGSTPTAIPDYIVAYVLHMTASDIVFLVNAEQNMK